MEGLSVTDIEGGQRDEAVKAVLVSQKILMRERVGVKMSSNADPEGIAGI